MNKVLITGTSKGLGYSLAKFFLKEKFYVAGLGRTSSSLNIPNCTVDFSNNSLLSSELCNNSILNQQFDIVILNAGSIGNIDLCTSISIDQLQEILAINLFSNKLIIDHFLQISSKSIKFFYISSGASLKGYTGWLEYCCSKSACDSMLRVYARENKNHFFLSISPGAINTGMQDIVYTSYSPKFPDLKKFYQFKNDNKLRDVDEAAFKITNFILCPQSYDSSVSGSFINV